MLLSIGIIMVLLRATLIVQTRGWMRAWCVYCVVRAVFTWIAYARFGLCSWPYWFAFAIGEPIDQILIASVGAFSTSPNVWFPVLGCAAWCIAAEKYPVRMYLRDSRLILAVFCFVDLWGYIAICLGAVTAPVFLIMTAQCACLFWWVEWYWRNPCQRYDGIM